MVGTLGTLVNSNKKDVKEVVELQKDPATEILISKFSHHPIHLLAGGQIGLGIVSITCQIVVTYSNDVHLNLSTINEGIFCGLIFLLAGSVGLYTSYRINQFNVKAFFVLNVFASLFSIILLLLSCCLLSDTLWYQEEDGYGDSSFLALKTFLSLEIVLSIIELSVSVTCASLCSKSCCYTEQNLVNAHNYPLVPVKMFSALQILVGVCSILFFFILFTLSFDTRHTLTFEEVYCGFVFIGIGIFGFFTVRRVSLTSLTPFMILNIFGCIFAGLLLVLALVRIYMIDKLEERFVHMKHEDLHHFPRINCTKDVLESINHQIKGTPAPDEIRNSIERCEEMKRDAIYEAEHMLSAGSEFEGPRKIFQLEIVLALFEALAAMVCASFCCRACCCCGKSSAEREVIWKSPGEGRVQGQGYPCQGEKDYGAESSKREYQT